MYNYKTINKGDWQPWDYSKRLQNAEKAGKKEKELSKSKTTEKTQRHNLTTYIGKTLHSRQYEVPLVAHHIDRAKSEPLHLKNNVVKEMFMKLLGICTAKSDLKNIKNYKDISENSLILLFVSHIRKEMGCNYLSKKVIQWFNESGGKLDTDFSFRFRGKESFAFLKHFPELINMILRNVTSSTIVVSRLHRIYFQFIQLRKIISFSVRVSNFDENLHAEMESSCILLFKSCSFTEDRISPSLWTLCHAAPYHARLTLRDYGLGLGVNTMEGREQKHQAINKYSQNTTYQNRWPMIFRHEFIQLIYLCENGFDTINYKKRSKKYIPDVSLSDCQKCGLKLVNHSCIICESDEMKAVEKEVGI